MLRNLSNRRAIVLAGMMVFLAGGAAVAQAAPSREPSPKPGHTITNSIGMKMVWIATGSFQMGPPGTETD